jgi:hypothetical protein
LRYENYITVLKRRERVGDVAEQQSACLLRKYDPWFNPSTHTKAETKKEKKKKKERKKET